MYETQANTYYSNGMKHETRARMKQKRKTNNRIATTQRLYVIYTQIHSFDRIFMSHTTTRKTEWLRKKNIYDECVFDKRDGAIHRLYEELFLLCCLCCWFFQENMQRMSVDEKIPMKKRLKKYWMKARPYVHLANYNLEIDVNEEREIDSEWVRERVRRGE